jgi:hypothetical protein
MRNLQPLRSRGQVGAAYAPMRPLRPTGGPVAALNAAMHRTRSRQQQRPHRRSEIRNGSGSKIVFAGLVGGFAVLAVLALPVIVPSADSPRVPPARNAWDAPSGAAQAGLDNITRATHAASITRLAPDPVSNVRDVSAKYTTARLAEIRDEVAKIDANEWRSERDLQRRQVLLAEERRLLRY